MKPCRFDYARPHDLAGALDLIARQDGLIKVMAGGQSLGPMLNLRLVEPDLIVDIAGVPQLRAAALDGDRLVLGACVTHSDIEDGRVPDVTAGAMARVASAIGYRAVRNRGTVGGSLAHADPAADWVTALAALDAEVELASPRARRRVALSDFIVGALDVALEPGELLVAVRVPALSSDARWGYAKHCRKVGEFAHAIGCVAIDPSAGRGRAVIGAIEAAPVVLADARPLFGGQIDNDFAARFDARVADAALIETGMASALDRHVHVTVLRRAVMQASGMTREDGRRMSMVSPASERTLPFALTVNGHTITARAEPRTHLADFLREGLGLTGTHLGCEHGVCGACTILLDGEPARACLTFAVAAEGSAVQTIEGLDDDEITTELRAAFTREHALQCGYCTPAMLISARDLVLRLPDADERRVRLGLAGNLCRCTGYVGIVRAIRSVIAARRARGIAPRVGYRSIGPVGAALAAAIEPDRPLREREKLALAPAASVAIPVPVLADFTPAHSFDHALTVDAPADDVFALFGRIEEVAACLPGASITQFRPPGTVEGLIRSKIGPIAATFRGAAQIERNSGDRSGRITAAGIDTSGRSTTQAIIRYRVREGASKGTTRVELTVGYTLKGPLAQFSRPALVRNMAERIIAAFAANLKARLSGKPPAPDSKLDLLSLLIGRRTNEKNSPSNDAGVLYGVEPVAQSGKDAWLLVGAPIAGILLYLVARWIFG